MREITDKNFGLIIAFLLPGFLLLWMLALSDIGSAGIGAWLKNVSEPSVSGFLYVTLASLALGLIISAIRWRFVDLGLNFYFRFRRKPLPEIDFTKLSDADILAAFQAANENHYRYYQYYSNTLVAIVVGSSIYFVRGKISAPWPIWVVIALLVLILLAASADCLFKYHERGSKITH